MISTRELEAIKHEIEGVRYYYQMDVTILRELIAFYEAQNPESENKKEPVILPAPKRSKVTDD